MALTWQTSYKKNGEEVKLKYPKLKVMGKLMDEDETHTFLLLQDGVQVREVNSNGQTYTFHSMFVRYRDDDNPFSLDLSQQSYNAISSLNPEKGDLLTVSKGWYENKKTGGKSPKIIASIVGKKSTQPTKRTTGKVPGTQTQISNSNTPRDKPAKPSISMQDFSVQFKGKMDKMKVEPASIMYYVFAGAYITKIKPEFGKKLKSVYDEMVK